jgi:hypothetical protein
MERPVAGAEDVNRRNLIKVRAVSMAVLLVPTRALVLTGLATPGASPVPATATRALTDRTYEAAEGSTAVDDLPYRAVTVWIEFRSWEPDAHKSIERSKQRLLDSPSDAHVPEEIEGAPTFGDESYAVGGGLGPSTEAVWTGSKVGRFVYSLAVFGEESDAFEQFAIDTTTEFVSRAESNDAPSEVALATLLPTEAEIGLPMLEQRYESGDYTPKP